MVTGVDLQRNGNARLAGSGEHPGLCINIRSGNARYSAMQGVSYGLSRRRHRLDQVTEAM